MLTNIFCGLKVLFHICHYKVYVTYIRGLTFLIKLPDDRLDEVVARDNVSPLRDANHLAATLDQNTITEIT